MVVTLYGELQRNDSFDTYNKAKQLNCMIKKWGSDTDFLVNSQIAGRAVFPDWLHPNTTPLYFDGL